LRGGIAFDIPIIQVTADAGHLYRGHYQERADLGLEWLWRSISMNRSTRRLPMASPLACSTELSC
jgi:hypothetical protein